MATEATGATGGITVVGINEALNAAATPAIIAVVIAIGIAQAIKALDHLLPTWTHKPGTQNIKSGLVIVAAWVLTAILFPFVCLGLGAPVKGINFGLGILAGVAAPIIVGMLKRVGLDLDKWLDPDYVARNP